MTNVTRLPGPVADVWDWQRMGLCRGRDSAQFFHPDGERGASRGRREAAAKALCGHCPVRAECAAHATLLDQLWHHARTLTGSDSIASVSVPSTTASRRREHRRMNSR